MRRVRLIFFMLSILLAVGGEAAFARARQARNTVEGQVFGPDRKPLVNARVSLLDDGYSQLAVVYTSSIGRFQFPNLGNGNYYVEVDPLGTTLERQSQRLQVQSMSLGGGGQTFRIDFVLVAKRAPDGRTNTQPARTVFVQEVPEAARREYDQGVKSLEEKKDGAAMEAFKRAVEIFPDYYAALEQLGGAYVERHDYKNAEPLLARAAEVNKDGWRAHYYLGIAQYNLKRPAEAMASLRRAVELNPESANANMWLGLILSPQAETRSEAIKAFEKVVQVAKDAIPDAYFYLGSLYSKNNQYKEAADALEHFLRLSPQVGDKEKLKKIIDQLRQKGR